VGKEVRIRQGPGSQQKKTVYHSLARRKGIAREKEKLKKSAFMALKGVTHKSLCWFPYVDDTFVIWPHGPGKLSEFLDHLNSIHGNIQFTMENERDSHLPFLNINIYHKSNDSLGYMVYQKLKHTH
jgi:hypothetical protein